MRGRDDESIEVELVDVPTPARLAAGSDAGSSATRLTGAAGGAGDDGAGDDGAGDVGAGDDSGADESGADDLVVAMAAHRRRRRVLLMISAAVVLGLGATGVALAVVDARRADARWDALVDRGLPVVHLDEPLQEVWRSEEAGWPTVVTAEVVVVQGWSRTLADSVWRGVDTATGEVLWERADPGLGWCVAWNPAWPETVNQEVAAGLVPPATASSAIADPTGLLCAEDTFGGARPEPGTTSTLRALDLATGRDTGVVTVEGSLMSFELAGRAPVLASVTPDGSIDVTRVDLVSDTEVWTARADVVALDQADGYLGVWAQLYDDAVVLASPDGEVMGAYDLETGEPVPGLRQLPVADRVQVVWLPDGTRVAVDYALEPVDDGSGGYIVGTPTVTVTGPDGDERFTVEGELWMPTFSDGSAADRIVVLRAGPDGPLLVALDVVTGEELWTSTEMWSSTLLQVDGVVVAGSGYMSATDLRTGEELWEHRGAALGPVAAVTDGTRFVVPTDDEDTDALVALDIRTGAEAWRIPTVPGIQQIDVVDDGVLVTTASALVLYR